MKTTNTGAVGNFTAAQTAAWVDSMNAQLDATQSERDPKPAATSGVCQICERTMKIDRDGVLSMHGHKGGGRGRCAGWCPGSARKPAPAVNALEEQIAKLRGEDAARFAGLIGKYEARVVALRAAR